jgi:hypothetical protein
MKKAIAFFFLFIFSLQCFNQAACWGMYIVNKAAYVRKCENKQYPWMHCDGKCVLMKKIKAAEERDSPTLKMALKSDIHSSKSFYPGILTPPLITSAIQPSPYFALLRKFSKDNFRPPGF